MPYQWRPRLPIASLGFVVILTTVLAMPAGALAGSESDIPGIPLPTPVVSGTLGGPIYDVVYRLDVPAGHVIVAGLRGTPGTDFDLYLFDASATTVVSNVGLLTKSTGPTSTEQLSWPSRTGGTFYLDLNGATAIVGAYTLSVQIVPDTTPPAISKVLLDGGAPATNDPAVSVLIAASDDISGVVGVALSADGETFGPWTPYGGQSSWTFPTGDGTKRLWVKVQNGVGLESAPVAASIVLDTLAPSVLSVSPAPGAVTTALRPTIRVTFSEPIDPSSWQTLGLVLQSATGSILTGSRGYDAAANVGFFTTDVDLLPGSVYFATIGAVRDVAGNPVIAPASWSLKSMLATSLTVRRSPATVTYGTPVTLSGIASIPPGEAVTVMSRPAASSDFGVAAQLLPAPSFSTTLVPQMTTSYRIDYPGSGTAVAASSPEVTVTVRWAVLLTGRGPAIVRAARVGGPVVVQARVAPTLPGHAVSFRLYRYDAGRRTFVYAGSRGTTTGPTGLASISWKPAVGRWQWRAVAFATTGYASGTSPAYTWSIQR